MRNLDCLESLVEDYIAKHKPDLDGLLNRMRTCKTPKDALVLATKYVDVNGLHGHQRRIGYVKLKECEQALCGRLADIMAASSFDQVHQIIESCLEPIRRVGPLTTYDISLRLAAYRGMLPENVYLHTGALSGARNFGLGGDAKLQKRALPKPLQRLAAHEIENFLCIYKRGPPSKNQRSRC